jgi:hypothetical protein
MHGGMYSGKYITMKSFCGQQKKMRKDTLPCTNIKMTSKRNKKGSQKMYT